MTKGLASKPAPGASRSGSAVHATETLAATELGDLPQSWRLVPIGDVFDVQQGKALSPDARLGRSPRPFLRTANVLWGRLDLTNVDRMDFTREEAERLALEREDLLVCEDGEIGRTAVWNGEIEGCLYQNHIHRLRRKRPDLVPAFVMYWMQAAFLQLGLYRGVGNRTTIPNLSGALLKQMIIPLPPYSEQAAIAALLERIQAAALVQEKRVGSLQTLFSSMLQALVTGQMRIAEGSEVGSRSGSSISRLDTASNERAMPASRSAGLAGYTLELARRFHPERIILFGSHADDTATADSDVDLLVIMDFEGRAAEQAARMDAALDRDFPLDLLVRRPREVQAALAAGDPFMREIVEKGVVLHDRAE